MSKVGHLVPIMRKTGERSSLQTKVNISGLRLAKEKKAGKYTKRRARRGRAVWSNLLFNFIIYLYSNLCVGGRHLIIKKMLQ